MSTEYDKLIAAGERLVIREEKDGSGRFIWLPAKTYKNVQTGMKAVADNGEIRKSRTFMVRDANPKEIEAYKSGKRGMVSYSELIHNDLATKEDEIAKLKAIIAAQEAAMSAVREEPKKRTPARSKAATKEGGEE